MFWIIPFLGTHNFNQLIGFAFKGLQKNIVESLKIKSFPLESRCFMCMSILSPGSKLASNYIITRRGASVNSGFLKRVYNAFFVF